MKRMETETYKIRFSSYKELADALCPDDYLEIFHTVIDEDSRRVYLKEYAENTDIKIG